MILELRPCGVPVVAGLRRECRNQATRRLSKHDNPWPLVYSCDEHLILALDILQGRCSVSPGPFPVWESPNPRNPE